MRIRFNAMLGLLLICLFNLVIVNHAESQSNFIFINTDGSISGTNQIRRNGNVYTLTGNLNNSPIVVECNHIVLDGGGYTLKGAGGWVDGLNAINLTCSDVTVQHFRIIGFWESGILGAWNNNTIANCYVTGTDRAMSIYADNYVVTGNSFASKETKARTATTLEYESEASTPPSQRTS